MGSSGMNWNQKNSVVWDWGRLAPIGPNAVGSSKSGPLPKPTDAGVGTTRDGSVSSSDATFTSSSELGYGSSMSASIGSPIKDRNVLEFNFSAVSRHDKNMSNNGEAGGFEDLGTSQSKMALCHGEPLISLKLGKRTYFENGCGGQNIKNPATKGATSPSTVVKKTMVSQQTQNSYCQVEGCNVDLSCAKNYHRKHKVCEAHSKAPKIVVAGLERRFCQQCSRLHGLAEFDQNKRSCRRRLSHHNARRRKTQTEAISLSSSRLSTMLYDPRQQTNLLFGQPPFGQVRRNAVSLWDNLEAFRFTETKFPSLKPTTMGAFDETHVSTYQMPNTVAAHAVHHHNFDGPMSSKGTNVKDFNQGVEASAIASNSNGAPGIGRALSLLSGDSWGSSSAVIQQASSHVHAGAMPPLVAVTASNPVMHDLDSTTGGFWQDDPPPLDGTLQIQAFTHQ